MKGHKKVIALLCLTAVFSFCRRQGVEAVRVETVDGVELVHNPADARVWLDLTPGLIAGGKMYQYKDDESAGSRILTRYKIVWKDN